MGGFGHRLDEHALAMLREAAARFGTQQTLAEAAGMKLRTLQKMLRGEADPSFSRVAAVAKALDLSLDALVGEAPAPRAPEAEFYPIPLVSVEASAGEGAVAGDEQVLEMLAFRKDWLRRRFGDPSALSLLRVRGDSQAPEILDGDLVMFDRSQSSIAEGLYLVGIDDHLLLKRIQFAGAGRLQLTSANPIYSPIDIDLKADEGSFRIVGRAVWNGRTM